MRKTIRFLRTYFTLNVKHQDNVKIRPKNQKQASICNEMIAQNVYIL